MVPRDLMDRRQHRAPRLLGSFYDPIYRVKWYKLINCTDPLWLHPSGLAEVFVVFMKSFSDFLSWSPHRVPRWSLLGNAVRQRGWAQSSCLQVLEGRSDPPSVFTMWVYGFTGGSSFDLFVDPFCSVMQQEGHQGNKIIGFYNWTKEISPARGVCVCMKIWFFFSV